MSAMGVPVSGSLSGSPLSESKVYSTSWAGASAANVSLARPVKQSPAAPLPCASRVPW